MYLKTQNYHWHVKGSNFIALHELFERNEELADAVDLIAERIVTMAHKVPATFTQINQLKTITDGNSSATANQMVSELAKDHGVLASDLMQAIKIAAENHDEGTVSLLSNAWLRTKKHTGC